MMILGCGLLTASLLFAAPMVLPHPSAAEASVIASPITPAAPPTETYALHRKPSAAHRMVRSTPMVVSKRPVTEVIPDGPKNDEVASATAE
jgi:hypothetical protein